MLEYFRGCAIKHCTHGPELATDWKWATLAAVL